MRKIFALLSLLFVLQSCSIFKSSKTPKNINDIYLYQNGKEAIVGDIIEIEKEAFSLIFWKKKDIPSEKIFHAIRIAASLDKASFSNIQIGTEASALPYFALGTGMAGNKTGYSHLRFNDTGHHYLYYESEDNNRLNLIEETDSYQKLGFNISSLFTHLGKEKIEDTDIREFYLAVFQDKNLNKIIDKEELQVLTIKIK